MWADVPMCLGFWDYFVCGSFSGSVKDVWGGLAISWPGRAATRILHHSFSNQKKTSFLVVRRVTGLLFLTAPDRKSVGPPRCRMPEILAAHGVSAVSQATVMAKCRCYNDGSSLTVTALNRKSNQ